MQLTSSGLLWRPAQRTEAWQVYRLHKSAAAALDRQYGPGPWSRIPFWPTLSRVVFSGAVRGLIGRGGALLGACTLTPHKIEYCNEDWFSPAAPAFYLRSMSIRPAAQGQGYGRALMRFAEEEAALQGAAALRLDAYAGPGGASGFYEKCGYSKVFTGFFTHAVLEVFEKRLTPPAADRENAPAMPPPP